MRSQVLSLIVTREQHHIVRVSQCCFGHFHISIIFAGSYGKLQLCTPEKMWETDPLYVYMRPGKSLLLLSVNRISATLHLSW